MLNSVTVDTASSRLQIESATYLKHEFIATAKQSAMTVSGLTDHSKASHQSSVAAIIRRSCSAPNPYLKTAVGRGRGRAKRETAPRV